MKLKYNWIQSPQIWLWLAGHPEYDGPCVGLLLTIMNGRPSYDQSWPYSHLPCLPRSKSALNPEILLHSLDLQISRHSVVQILKASARLPSKTLSENGQRNLTKTGMASHLKQSMDGSGSIRSLPFFCLLHVASHHWDVGSLDAGAGLSWDESYGLQAAPTGRFHWFQVNMLDEFRNPHDATLVEANWRRGMCFLQRLHHH